ncbi:MAG: S8 family peptidase [Firmicutes bacterium]|nr:S8 family peptidase [Bacillota bacterium]MBE3590874.1 S8 family peptidase [Bacillota bacterium]
MHEIDWLETHAHKVSASLRRLVLALHGAPMPLPAAAVPLWLQAWLRVASLDLIVRGPAEEALEDVHAAVARARGRMRRAFPRFGAAHVRVPARGLPALLEHEAITYVTLNYPVRTALDTAVPTVAAPRLWDRSFTGRNVTIGIVDTGVWPHVDLTQPRHRILAFHDLVGGRHHPYDDNGHGTHVAGDAAGNGQASGGRFRGPAPDARLVCVKALDRHGSGTAARILEGIDWLLAHRERYNIRVISLSLGAPADARAEDPLVAAVERAWREGVVVCAAAGNDGPQEGSITTPGVAPSIVTVGASDDRSTLDPSDDVVAIFSGRGPAPRGVPKPDLVAPGVAVTSLRAPGARLGAGGAAGRGYVTLSGTSMATPIVAGVVAQLLEAVPDALPDEVKSALLGSARDLGAPREAQGHGCADAAAALDALRRLRAARV